MKKQQWLDAVRERRENLLNLISRYHPSSPERGDTAPMTITAGAAEDACERFRQDIAKDKRNPTERFNTALVSGDVDELLTLLSDAWLGVPESTSCWGITGFSDCVDMLDDPPTEEA